MKLETPGIDRVVALYQQGMGIRQIARDEQLVEASIFHGLPNAKTRSNLVHYLLQALLREGVIERREGSPSTNHQATSPVTSPVTSPDGHRFEHYLKLYEGLIGAPTKRREVPQSNNDQVTRRIVVLSDLHIPDERIDLIDLICQRHAGDECVLAGDLLDLTGQSKYLNTHKTISLQESFARLDVLLYKLSQVFSTVTCVFGNHDMRLPRCAARTLGPDYYWMSQQFLMQAIEARHGIRLAKNIVQKGGGSESVMCSWHQCGDAIISHLETHGKPVGKSAEGANRFLAKWKNELGLQPWRVLLQAHSHKRSMHYDQDLHTYCYEIGALCKNPEYSLSNNSYAPVKHGYVSLVQVNGVTDVNRIGFYDLDEPL